jgi:hypothetical protein
MEISFQKDWYLIRALGGGGRLDIKSTAKWRKRKTRKYRDMLNGRILSKDRGLRGLQLKKTERERERERENESKSEIETNKQDFLSNLT